LHQRIQAGHSIGIIGRPDAVKRNRDVGIFSGPIGLLMIAQELTGSTDGLEKLGDSPASRFKQIIPTKEAVISGLVNDRRPTTRVQGSECLRLQCGIEIDNVDGNTLGATRK
jgi:hypothetical protein